MKTKEPETQFVDMIASGYEWTCPNCDHGASSGVHDPLNKEIETKDKVACPKCKSTYQVGEVLHANG